MLVLVELVIDEVYEQEGNETEFQILGFVESWPTSIPASLLKKLLWW